MAAIDGATKSLMQGVSQQVPRERLDGQVSLQVNMLSDAVEGMRRRPGMRYLTSNIFPGGAWNKEQVFATSVDIGDEPHHILINTATGVVNVYNSNMSLVATDDFFYLLAPTAASIQVAALRGYLYICNTEQFPVKNVTNAGKQNPDKTGFFFVKTGQYSKIYNVTLNVNGVQYASSYTTPNGSAPGDAALSTPEYVAGKLVDGIVAHAIPGLSFAIAGSYVYLVTTGAGAITVTSDSGTNFISASNQSHVTLTTELPARMPAAANGMLVSVGANPSLSVWYRFDFVNNAWVESGAWNSADFLTNMPIRLKLDNSYVMDQPNYEGRLSGNDNTNEDPAFLTDGVTGLSVFQGRLVILSGATVCMSAAGKPLRWYRSTTTELLVADPISIFSGSATTANFTHAIQFNKDLLLFAKTCQAVVPSGNSVVAPSTAQIVITSAYNTTSKVLPIVAGRSLMYFAPRSEKFASVLEMVPSNTTDSQYTTNDVTAHIPQYMPGTIRQATASTTSNSLVLVADGDARTLFVHEYLWGGDEKLQSAWHNWTAPYDIVCTWFVRDTIYVGMLVDGDLAIVTIDSQAGDTANGLYRPFSDMFIGTAVVGGTFTVPTALRAAYTAGAELQLTYTTGAVAGEAVGFSINTATWVGTAVRNVPDGTYFLGLKYRSTLSPTPPLLRDQNGVVIGTAGTSLIRYEASLKNTGDFHVVVQRHDETTSEGVYSGLTYSSQDLIPGGPLYAKSSRCIIPVRLNPDASSVIMYAEDDHDLGVLTLEHVMQYHPRRRRM
ncbi:hypothetical protein C171_00490 [Pseudomonas phage YMC11/06/C171_PPU_BP]|uniref:Tail tubular protein B n=1 Tax=Pseudomonas phage YMC11/06/C171_PPU_BP TaxID=1777063 RepID=A0A140IET4_9CAUD|nr:tail protein [Pseudomonas phage YMC11/06/C171_PPU_BP]AMO43673.1 hypothetical protein C171_00490 [Pseudomonas phage YMC11/06/C171_PPU_BP]